MNENIGFTIIVISLIIINSVAHAYKVYKTDIRIKFLENEIERRNKHLSHIEDILVKDICIICRNNPKNKLPKDE